MSSNKWDHGEISCKGGIQELDRLKGLKQRMCDERREWLREKNLRNSSGRSLLRDRGASFRKSRPVLLSISQASKSGTNFGRPIII